MFTVIATTIWISAHIYVGFRTIETSQLQRRARTVLWGILLLNAAAFIAAIQMRYYTSDALWFIILKYWGYCWAGIFLISFMFILIRDLIYLGVKGYAKIASSIYNSKSSKDIEDPMKRHLFSGAVSASLFAAAGGMSAIGYRQATQIPDLKYVDVPFDNLHPALDQFKIVLLSDIHVGPTIDGEFLCGVVERTNSVGADLVALTGDFVDGYVPQLREETAALKDIQARHGLFYCTGNHEYYWDGPGWCKEVARLGGEVLIDKHKVIEHNGALIAVGGVADYSMKRNGGIPGHHSSPIMAMKDAPPEAFKLLLAHQPKSIWEAVEANVDLQLSGHTHGGQFWPWNYIVGLAHPISAGLGTFGNTKIYVSRGTGYWGPPNRFMTPSEITVITLRRA